MAWLYFALSVVLANTSIDLLQRILSVKTENPRRLAVAFNIYGIIFAAIMLLVTGNYQKFSFPLLLPNILVVAIGALLYGGFERLRFAAAKNLEVSVMITLFTVSLGINFIGSALFFQEPVTPSKILGFSLIVLAIFLVSMKSFKKVDNKHLYLGILTAVFLGSAWINDKVGTSYFNAETYTSLMWFFPIFVIYSPKISVKEYIHELKEGSWKLFLLAAFNVTGYYLFLSGLRLAEASRFIPITQINILTSTLAGVLLLKERDNVVLKIFASLMAFAGVFFLTR